ncbi:MAG TPA: hypothetical protein VGS97_25915 [Actinocrinis sp.]|uniref:hypothetical protein n=1 Tax=Actinocrinis sp. TaxID=1920516 RepID=UPI002DDD44E7|nr:hypothetical protein [Actinocrinis sp.]HEV2347554.1 hypothetical protein [Actinocrinis sp.]
MRNFIGTRRILPAALAVGALLLVALITVPLLVLHHTRTGANPATPSPAPSTSPIPIPSGTVTLVQGARLANGIEVGYPHTTVGAISAAAQYLDAVASTLDPDCAASVMRLAGDPANTALPTNLADSTVKLRADLHLPTSGRLAPPTAFQTTAQMYQLRDASADHVLVLLLTLSTFINDRGGMAQTTGVFPVRMHWSGGDWKLAAIGGADQDYSGLAATPDTQTAVSRGWQALAATTGGAP